MIFDGVKGITCTGSGWWYSRCW